MCQQCQPAVEDALRRSDQRAQVEAWGSALNRGAIHSQSVQGAGDSTVGRLWLWRLKGLLWTAHLAMGFLGYLSSELATYQLA